MSTPYFDTLRERLTPLARDIKTYLFGGQGLIIVLDSEIAAHRLKKLLSEDHEDLAIVRSGLDWTLTGVPAARLPACPAPPAIADKGFRPTPMGDALIEIAHTSASAVAAIAIPVFALVLCFAIGGR